MQQIDGPDTLLNLAKLISSVQNLTILKNLPLMKNISVLDHVIQSGLTGLKNAQLKKLNFLGGRLCLTTMNGHRLQFSLSYGEPNDIRLHPEYERAKGPKCYVPWPRGVRFRNRPARQRDFFQRHFGPQLDTYFRVAGFQYENPIPIKEEWWEQSDTVFDKFKFKSLGAHRHCRPHRSACRRS